MLMSMCCCPSITTFTTHDAPEIDPEWRRLTNLAFMPSPITRMPRAPRTSSLVYDTLRHDAHGIERGKPGEPDAYLRTAPAAQLRLRVPQRVAQLPDLGHLGAGG